MYLVDGFIPKPGEVIYDVGSQYGDWAILWAKKYGAEVYAFEPLESNLAAIWDNVRINDLYNKVSVISSFVGNGLPLFFERRGDMAVAGWSKLLSKHFDRLDDLIKEYNFKFPAIIKIDVEGFEMAVLEGAENILLKKPRIIVETHSKALRQDCEILLMDCYGYTLKYVGRTVKGKDWMDEITNLFFAADGVVK
jgi:FkbM family methyltransferase